MPEWLKDAVFYEIYPQSFYDSNNDGIGDLQGIIDKLDYIKDLGCNALWINPCFDSPFLDAGYDVRDYKKVAPRYGTNETLIALFEKAHEKGIKVLLDLVPGHTSDQHPWFLASKKAEHNEYSDRYIWTSHAFEGIAGRPYISGMSERAGAYMLNFFASQPALNYGWLNRTENWQSAVDSEEAIATREAIKDVMRFWMDLGCDGYRVDMADSLVKNDDDNKSATSAIWRNVREMMDRDYPECALVSEWSNPYQAINGAGFHMDFYLDHHYNGYNTLLRDYETEGGDHSFFLKEGHGDIMRFLDDYLPKYEATKDNGYIAMFTCNHDTPRPARTLNERELKLAYAFILTMPGVPFIYYGDEIGMKYLDVKTKEGGYQRTGSRTPMQWDESPNKGFSKGNDIYLPVDADGPSVQVQMENPDSLYYTVKEIISLRHRYEDLQADADFKVIYADKEKYPFVYQRGSLLLAVNPSEKETETVNTMFCDAEIIYQIGKAEIGNDQLKLFSQSFAIIKIAENR
ncbi:MAG: glycosylase [Solobacterium sp.]|nr:glycosylase [Solobacterium sp.]